MAPLLLAAQARTTAFMNGNILPTYECWPACTVTLVLQLVIMQLFALCIPSSLRTCGCTQLGWFGLQGQRICSLACRGVVCRPWTPFRWLSATVDRQITCGQQPAHSYLQAQPGVL